MAQKTKKKAFYLSSAIIIAIISVFLFNYPPQQSRALSTILCDSTPVSSGDYTGADDLVFSDGGDGICILTGAFNVNSVLVNPNVILTHTAEEATGITITTVGDFTMDVNSTINVDEKGCKDNATTNNGYGPNSSNVCTYLDSGGLGAGTGRKDGVSVGASGAGHGGSGGRGTYTSYTGGSIFDENIAPIKFGASGGTGWGVVGGAGGGFIQLDIGGTFINNGGLTANGGSGVPGGNHSASGAGSGGSIYINTVALAGTTGTFSVDGGIGGDGDTTHDGGGGSGGRIALIYGSSTFSGLGVGNFSASGGLGPDAAIDGDNGTVYVKDSTTNDVNIYYGFTYDSDFSVNSWTVDSSAEGQYCDGTDATPSITATEDINLSGEFDCTNSSITGFDLSAGTGIAMTDFEFDMEGTILTSTSPYTYAIIKWTIDDAVPITLENSTINANVQWTNLSSLSLDETSSINTNEKGCPDRAADDEGYAPNASNICIYVSPPTGLGAGDGYKWSHGVQGAGHGGHGGLGTYTGSSANAGGNTYDSETEPSLIGSSGGSDNESIRGGYGGGLIRLGMTGDFTFNGALSADGGAGLTGSTNLSAGGGSGGSIYITTGGAIYGSTGSLSSDGGDGGNNSTTDGGGAGGGRVSISGVDSTELNYLSSLATADVATGGSGNELGQNGDNGTFYTLFYTAPDEPTTTAPSGADQLRNPTGTTSAYSSNGATHTTTDWQISDDDTFSDSDCSDTNIVWCALDNANKESVVVNTTNGTFANSLSGKTQLAPSTVYYLRTRHTNAAGDSSWSSSVSFTTVANNNPDNPTNSSPADSATDQSKTPTLASSVYSDSDSDDHSNSSWEIYESSDCSGDIAWRAYNDSTNLESIDISSAGSFLNDHLDQTELKGHTQYSWTASHTDEYSGSSNFSNCTSFTTANVAPNLDSSIPTQSLTEDTDVVGSFDLDTYFSDADWNDDDDYTCTATNDLSATLGTMTINADQTIDFTLVANANGSDTIQFSCEDNDSTATSSNEVTVDVAAVNDTPISQAGSDQAVTEEDEVTLDPSASSDVDIGDTLTYSWTEITDSSDGCSRSGNTVTTLNKESSYDCVYGLIVNDGTIDSTADTMTISVTASNDAPVFGSIASTQTIDEEDSLIISFTASDPDTSSLILSASDLPTSATFTDNANNTGTFNWTPDGTQSGTYPVTFQLTDGETTTTQTITITVNDTVQDEEPESPDEGDTTTIDDIGLISGSESGLGIVTLYDKSNNALCSVQAWGEGGAVPKTIKFLDTYYVSVIKNRTGSTIHLYDLNCNIVEKKKLSAKLHPRQMVTRNFLGKATSQEIGATSRRGSTVYGKIFRYNPNKDKWYLLRQQTFRPVPLNYTLDKTKKGNILIKNNNKTLHTWKI